MGCLAKGVGLVLVGVWTAIALTVVIESRAHGEPTLPGVLLLGSAALAVAVILVVTAIRVVPAWRGARGSGPPLIAIALAVVATAGIHLAVEQNVANQRPSPEITAGLGPSCRGLAVAGAASPSNAGGNHLVVLALDGAEHDWTGNPPLAWRPSALADAELVVCIPEEESRRQIEVCDYTGGPDITRYAVSREVEVRDAATGRLITRFTASGEPRECRQTEDKDLTELVGSLGWDEIEKLLTPYVGG